MKLSLTIRLALSLLILTWATGSVVGQQKNQKPSNPFSDSVTVSSGEYMLHIADLYQKIDSIKNISRLGGYIRDTQVQLEEIDTIQYFITQSLDRYSSSLNVRNLQMLDLLLKNAQSDLGGENEKLAGTYITLNRLKQELSSLRSDSIVKRLLNDSTALKNVYPQLKELGINYFHTDSVLKRSSARINTLKVKGSSEEITGLLLITDIQKQKRSAIQRLPSKEVSFLWNASKESVDLTDKMQGVYQTESKALRYYFREFNGGLFFLFFFTALFYLWIRSNLNKIEKAGQFGALSGYGVQFIAVIPSVATLAAMLCVAPLFDLHAPATYVEVLQFLLLIAVTVLLYKSWSKDKFKRRIYVVVLYALFIIGNHFHDPGILQRLLMIGLKCLVQPLCFH